MSTMLKNMMNMTTINNYDEKCEYDGNDDANHLCTPDDNDFKYDYNVQ